MNSYKSSNSCLETNSFKNLLSFNWGFATDYSSFWKTNYSKANKPQIILV